MAIENNRVHVIVKVRQTWRRASTHNTIRMHRFGARRIVSFDARTRHPRFNAERIRMNNTTPRLYDTVRVRPFNTGLGIGNNVWTIELDGHVLCSKEGSVFFPSEALALAVGSEWERQGRFIKPTTMPLMTITALAINGYCPGETRDKNMKLLFDYVKTDTVCFRSTTEGLQERQDSILGDLVSWADTDLGIKLQTTTGFKPIEFSDETLQRYREAIEGLSPWQLAVLDTLTKITKSVTIPLAFHHGKLDATGVCIAARVEEDYQIEEWGEVEGGHDIDYRYTYVKVFSASTFHKLLNMSD